MCIVMTIVVSFANPLTMSLIRCRSLSQSMFITAVDWFILCRR